MPAAQAKKDIFNDNDNIDSPVCGISESHIRPKTEKHPKTNV